MKFDDLLTGCIRLHVLHHAAEHEVYGQRMIEEFANHGCRLSPGTLYYKATRLGKQGLALAKLRVREFTGEAMKH